MPSNQQPSTSNFTSAFGLWGQAAEYMIDAGQRSILFWDVMRQRGNQYRAHLAKQAPNVLDFTAELVVDGRTFARPVNYALVRIVPPSGAAIDISRRPFVVVDPRAGHGPGIGGFKADSEIGEALKAGHPCYFIGFLPEPMPGQTIEDIARAEAIFLEKVNELHPNAEGKPCVVGNCQAGWAIAMLAAMRPELFGPIILAGSPLSYWAGVRGQNPLRYFGGLTGGSWLTELTSDLGNGKFDGVWLVQNFENLNPSNTLWSKSYNLYSKVDTEAPRYLGFERWWGGHVNMNAEEIQFIVDQLFIGNNLATGRIQTSDGATVDLRNIRSPIVVLCSKGDNITPPQQALDWILDLYDDVDQIRAYGQTIVYTVHETIGHLGIFVSSSVARKEHSEFSSNIDMIELLPPGLYEATFEVKSADAVSPDLVSGDWIMRCEPRTLDDIRALGSNDVGDERRFETAARVSEMNRAFYHTFVQPTVRAMTLAPVTEWSRRLHPLRLQFETLSDSSPQAAPLSEMARQVQEKRRPAAADNPFGTIERKIAHQIVAGLDAWRDLRDDAIERAFLLTYGNPWLQAAMGVDPKETRTFRRAGESPLHRQLVEARISELRSRIAQGAQREALTRALLYIGIARGGVDERGVAALRRARIVEDGMPRLTLSEFKGMVREQYFMLLIDLDAALAAIPNMLPHNPDQRRRSFAALCEILRARGEIAGEAAQRLERIAELFGVEVEAQPTPDNLAHLASYTSVQAKAS
jgi:pimeloyl-ACP methyl ester carboxylesterase